MLAVLYLYDEYYFRTPLSMSAYARERTGGPLCSIQTCTTMTALAWSLHVFMIACVVTRAHVAWIDGTC